LSLASCATGISIRTDFEGGCLDRIEQLSETSFIARVPGQADREGRNRQVSWYSFRVDGARGREVAVTLHDLAGEYDYRPGAVAITHETIPLFSDDGVKWTHFGSIDYNEENTRLTMRFTPRGDSIWIAHVEPYTPARLFRILDEIGGRPHVRVESAGTTGGGRDLPLVSITNSGIPDASKKVLWFMARQHAWETGTSFVAEGLLRFAASDDPEARRLRDRAIVKVFPMLDPDGCAAGAVRFNPNGFDVNRNWDTCDLSSAEHCRLMPEIWYAKRALNGWLDGGRPIHFFIALHHEEKDEWVGASEDHRDLAERLFRRLREETSFDPHRPGPTISKGGPPASGRMTVYDYLQRERRVPAFLMELRITRSAKLGRWPTSQDRLGFGRELLLAAARAVLE
jgi:hypothetical protein